MCPRHKSRPDPALLYGGGIVESVRLRLGARRGGEQRVATGVSARGWLRKRSVPRYGAERYRERRQGRPARSSLDNATALSNNHANNATDSGLCLYEGRSTASAPGTRHAYCLTSSGPMMKSSDPAAGSSRARSGMTFETSTWATSSGKAGGIRSATRTSDPAAATRCPAKPTKPQTWRRQSSTPVSPATPAVTWRTSDYYPHLREVSS